MKMRCGWRTPQSSLGRRSYGKFSPSWRRGKARMKDESTAGVSQYMEHVSDLASYEAFRRQEEAPLLSAEALPEHQSLIDFKAYAQEYPERMMRVLTKMRPEFQEYFIEYYLLGKSQSFIGQTHGCIQTRIWQSLRIIEQTIGALIVLGTDPDGLTLQPVLRKAGLEDTPFGSMTNMVLMYAATQNYTVVAKQVGAPQPAIRKIFRPAVQKLLADTDPHAICVGAYLRNLTHRASPSKAGLSKSSINRLRRVKTMRFSAPAESESPLLSFGNLDMLGGIEWWMLEISSEHRMNQIYPVLQSQAKRVFGKHPGQIFAPLNADGDLAFGYIFARSTSFTAVRALTRLRGVAEIVCIYDEEGKFIRTATVPAEDVEGMMAGHAPVVVDDTEIGDFVEILTGPAARYCGTVTTIKKNLLRVEVNFPTDRQFIVSADQSCVRLIPDAPIARRSFWGVTP